MTEAGGPIPLLQAEIGEAAEAIGLALTDVQRGKIASAVAQLRESAARVRVGLTRNDEPAFGFRRPPVPGDKT
jgi:hypothetical protein